MTGCLGPRVYLYIYIYYIHICIYMCIYIYKYIPTKPLDKLKSSCLAILRIFHDHWQKKPFCRLASGPVGAVSLGVYNYQPKQRMMHEKFFKLTIQTRIVWSSQKIGSHLYHDPCQNRGAPVVDQPDSHAIPMAYPVFQLSFPNRFISSCLHLLQSSFFEHLGAFLSQTGWLVMARLTQWAKR